MRVLTYVVLRLFTDELEHEWFKDTIDLVHKPYFVLLASFRPQHLESLNYEKNSVMSDT